MWDTHLAAYSFVSPEHFFLDALGLCSSGNRQWYGSYHKGVSRSSDRGIPSHHSSVVEIPLLFAIISYHNWGTLMYYRWKRFGLNFILLSVHLAFLLNSHCFTLVLEWKKSVFMYFFLVHDKSEMLKSRMGGGGGGRVVDRDLAKVWGMRKTYGNTFKWCIY